MSIAIRALVMLFAASGTVFASSAELTAYRLPITREGQTQTRLSYDSWSGEYPMPIIDLNSQTPGATKVVAYASLRTLDKPVACTIQNGIYSPWAQSKNSAKTYYTIIALAEYAVLKNLGLQDASPAVDLHVGDKLIDEIPLAEGFCRYTLVKGATRRNVETMCVLNQPDWKRLSKDDPFREQWIYLSCQEGYFAFIQDKDLSSAPGAAFGDVVEFGKAGPKKK